jgi:hypothetical protein
LFASYQVRTFLVRTKFLAHFLWQVVFAPSGSDGQELRHHVVPLAPTTPPTPPPKTPPKTPTPLCAQMHAQIHTQTRRSPRSACTWARLPPPCPTPCPTPCCSYTPFPTAPAPPHHGLTAAPRGPHVLQANGAPLQDLKPTAGGRPRVSSLALLHCLGLSNQISSGAWHSGSLISSA